MKEVFKITGLYLLSIFTLLVGFASTIIGFLGIFYQWLFNDSTLGIFMMGFLFLFGTFALCFGLALVHHLYKDSHYQIDLKNGFKTLYENPRKSENAISKN
jgi:hypothetical protein